MCKDVGEFLVLFGCGEEIVLCMGSYVRGGRFVCCWWMLNLFFFFYEKVVKGL